MTARSLPVMPNFFAGQKLTGSVMNQVGTFGTFWANPPMFRMYQSVAQNILNGTYTQVTCDTPDYDTDSGISTSPYSYIIPAGMTGRWYFAGMIGWGGNVAGIRIAALYRNGSQITGPNAASAAGPSANVTNVFVAATVAVNAGDSIGLFGYQSSGGTLSTNVGGGSPSFFEGRLVSLGTP